MDRVYHSLLNEHLRHYRQMAFLTGPRQVGKTTSARASAPQARYCNWDDQTDRQVIVRGPQAVAEQLELQTLRDAPAFAIFDEIHKYRKWRTFLKGLFDKHADDCRFIVTGSARLNIARRGGDSLMGRYFLYRMHPLSVAELCATDLLETEVRGPGRADPNALEQLIRFGGFPEPFLTGTTRFYNRWKRLRLEQLFHEELRDLTQVQETAQMEVLAALLTHQSGQLVNYTALAANVNVAVDTIRRWMAILESLYYCFLIRPWFRNVPKSLRKQPKVYLWDWSLLPDAGARYENFVASHLLKAVQWWSDIGLGSYDLFYLRDKAKREVDFLVTRENKPWFLVEVKSSSHQPLSASLHYFHRQLQTEHAFQVVFDLAPVERDCFSPRKPVIVPAASLLTQLV